MVRLPWSENELPSYEIVRQFIVKYSHTNGYYEIVHDKYNIFQFWNKEYIEALSKEVIDRVAEDLVLEVCAGDGQLTHWLKEKGVNIIATDNFERGLKPKFSVIKFSAIRAIKKHNPVMVIASWIEACDPLDYRILKTGVPYVILIGEPEGITCGSERAWRAFKRLGYRQDYLQDVDKYNLCRTDYTWSIDDRIRPHSATVLFSRLESKECE